MITTKPIHPFPARMAPEIALDECRRLPSGALVLDPMCGSGTVLRVAAEMGHESIGCDLDPLAVLISSAWTCKVPPEAVLPAAKRLVARAEAEERSWRDLPWLQDEESRAFIESWFAEDQRRDLGRLSFTLMEEEGSLSDILRVCLSRTIITKERGASLARDVSHSRPHKVRTTNDFKVMPEFLKSAGVVGRRLSAAPIIAQPNVSRSDARRITHLPDGSVDVVITSPPYLNAIDYMRGHKFSLVWLGHSISELRDIRSASVGTERQLDPSEDPHPLYRQVQELPWFSRLPKREAGVVLRYASDVLGLAGEIVRVLKRGGKVVLIIGNSCLRGVYIENSHVVELAARHFGLACEGVYTRDLPASKRYLPTPAALSADDLAKRMRKECILTFARA